LIHKKPKTAQKLHGPSALYAHKLTTNRRTLGKSNYSQGLGLEQGAACHPPSSLVLSFSWWRRVTALRAYVIPFP